MSRLSNVWTIALVLILALLSLSSVSASTENVNIAADGTIHATPQTFDETSNQATGTVPIPEAIVGEVETDRSSYRAAILTPKFAMCVVTANPGVVKFCREEATYYPNLNVYFTGDVPRLQIFKNEQHLHDNIVDSDIETEEQIIERLLNPDKKITPALVDMELSLMNAGEIAKALEFYGIDKSPLSRPGYPDHDSLYMQN